MQEMCQVLDSIGDRLAESRASDSREALLTEVRDFHSKLNFTGRMLDSPGEHRFRPP